MKAGRVYHAAVAFFLLLWSASLPNSAKAQQLIGPMPAPPPGKPEVIPDQFIVELKRGVDQDAFINEHRLPASLRYTIINGFAARMPQIVADRLAADARVHLVSPDLVVRAFPKPPGSGGGGSGGGSGCTVSPGDMPTPEIVPTGVSRIGAGSAARTGSGIKVAVIDTGIDPCHPDLKDNYKGGKNLLVKGDSPPKDDNGHGTHVAGIIAARENEFGVVGVAPEASLYAVKVLDKEGAGTLSTAIKGLDWAAKNGMRVANMSLGAFDLSLGSGPMCNAVRSAVLTYGVMVVVAAGNSAFEALYFTPANCLYSFTVSAFMDSDGRSGSLGPSFSINGIDEMDDTFAETFSNFSDYCWDLDGDGLCTNADSLLVNLMAPGVEIFSTMPTYTVTLNTSYNKPLNYATLTGTSMAAPHVAGAAALFLQANPTATPAEVRTALTMGGECPDGKPGSVNALACTPAWPDDGFNLGWEPLLSAGGL